MRHRWRTALICAGLGIVLSFAPRAAAQIVATDPFHQQLLHEALVNDRDIFDVSKSEGFVTRASPEAADAIVAKFARMGVTVTPEQARAVLAQILLRAKGRLPSKIDPSMLLAPYADDHRTLHGHLAEVDITQLNSERYRFSKGNSISADGTIYVGGRESGGWQSKCYATLSGSRDGIIEGFTKFLRLEYRSNSTAPYEGFIPRDQYDAMVRAGVIDQNGRFQDLADLRARMEDVYDSMRRGGYDDNPKVKEALQQSQKLASQFTTETLRKLQFKPLPDTYDGYKNRVRQLPEQAQIGPHAASPPNQAKGRAALVALFLSVTWEVGSLGIQPVRPIDLASAGLGMAQELDGVKRIPKSARSAIAKLPRSLQRLVPSAKNLSLAGKLAGRAAILVTVGVAAWDIISYSRGKISQRQFETAMGGTGGALAGGAGGAKLGALIGLSAGGPLGASVGAVVGGIAGGLVGAFAAESLVSSYWSSLDEADRAYALELLKTRIRNAGIPVN
jgi:hypothetical protein